MKFHFLHLITIASLSLFNTFCYGLSIGSTVSKGFTFSPPKSSDLNFSPFLASSSGQFAAGIAQDSATGAYSLAIAGIDTSTRPLDFIWSANPRHPFRTNSPPEFTFDAETGQLRVLGSTKELLWNSPPGGQYLELQDTGNLILLSNASVRVWQSFDSPTDVLMQGQNFTQGMQLVSESGEFSMQLARDRLVLFADTEPYWAISALREHEVNKSGVPVGDVYMRIQDGFFGLYESEQVRVHFQPFSSLSRAPGNFTRRMKLRRDGNLVVYYWQEGSAVEDFVALSDPCSFPSACGPFGICSSSDSNSTCRCPDSASAVVEKDLDKCKIGVDSCEFSDQFDEVQGVEYFANDISALLSPSAGEIATLEDCKSRCLGNCSCRAFFFRNDTGACFHTDFRRTLQASGNLQNLAYIRVRNPEALAAAARSRSNRRKHALGIALLVLVVFSACFSIVVGACFLRKRLKEKKEGAFSDGEGSSQEIVVLRDRNSIASC